VLDNSKLGKQEAAFIDNYLSIEENYYFANIGIRSYLYFLYINSSLIIILTFFSFFIIIFTIEQNI
jgi:hypothetical protein